MATVIRSSSCFVCEVATEIKNHSINWLPSLLCNFIRNRFFTYLEFSGFSRSSGILTILGLLSGFSKMESSRGYSSNLPRCSNAGNCSYYPFSLPIRLKLSYLKMLRGGGNTCLSHGCGPVLSPSPSCFRNSWVLGESR